MCFSMGYTGISCALSLSLYIYIHIYIHIHTNMSYNSKSEVFTDVVMWDIHKKGR